MGGSGADVSGAFAVKRAGISLEHLNIPLEEAAKISFPGSYRKVLFILLRLETNAIKRINNTARYVPQMGANPLKPAKV